MFMFITCRSTMENVLIWKCLFLLISFLVLLQGGGAHTKQYRVSTLLQPPMVMRDEKTGEYSGIMIDVLRQTGYLGEVKALLDSPYGMEEQPQKLKDVLQDVSDGISDIAIVALDSDNRKSLGVTFTQHVINGGYIVLYKIPEEWNPSYTTMMTLIEPFSPGLWCLIMLMAVLSSVVLFVLRWFSPFEARHTQEPPTTARSNSFMYMFASLMGQSSADAPRSFSARVVACVWWVFSLMTAGAYIGGLLALLLRMNPRINTIPFGNMHELLRQNEVEVLVVRDSATHRFLRHHPYFNNTGIWRQWVHHVEKYALNDVGSAMDKMMKSDGGYVVYMSEITANYLANSLPCDKMVVAEPRGDQMYGFACKKNSSLCDELDQAVLRLRDTGRINKLVNRYTRKGCSDKGSEYFYHGQAYIDTFGVGDPNWLSPMTMTIKRFSGGFLMLVIGFGAAFLVLLAEILYTRWRGIPYMREASHRHKSSGSGISNPGDFQLNQDLPQ